MKTKTPLTRRQFAQQAACGAAALLLVGNAAQAADPAPVTPTPITPPPNLEDTALIQAVPANVGYALSDTQALEVKNALTGYHDNFAKLRAFAIPSEIEPAFASYSPAPTGWKGRPS